MSNLFGRTRPMDASRTLPTGETVGNYTSYLDAQKAVDYLADHQFPVQLVSIVGNDLKTVERVTGRLSYPRVALSGALTGAWFGLFVGVLLSFFGNSGGNSGMASFSVITSIVMGAAFWMLFGIASYAMQRGKRDFTSTSQVLATSYDVIVAPEAVGDARALLAQLPMTPQPAGAHRPTQPYRAPHAPQAPPQRPNGWTDPYAEPKGGKPAEPAAETDGAEQAPVEGAVQAPTGSTPGTFPDLPDGRPQYGVRLPGDEATRD